jgi:phosphoribosylpyrophosphate synthetase
MYGLRESLKMLSEEGLDNVFAVITHPPLCEGANRDSRFG